VLHIRKLLLTSAALLVGYSATAQVSESKVRQSWHPISSILRDIKHDNGEFVSSREKTGYFSRFQHSQHPKMALVGCGDSRVHMHAISDNPDDKVFALRNLSGQLKSSEAGIIFAVNHAHAPILVFMGHGNCGAVATKTQLEWIAQVTKLPIPKKAQDLEAWVSKVSAALKKTKYSYLLDWFQGLMAGGKDSFPLIQELGNVKIARAAVFPAPGSSQEKEDRFHKIVHENTKYNTHYQVQQAYNKFKDKIKAGELIVAGALYDFQDREHQGKGRFIWIDARDEKTDPRKAFVKRVGGMSSGDSDLAPRDIPSEKGVIYELGEEIYKGVGRLKKLEQYMPYAGPHKMPKAKVEAPF